jgi:class 3 adenylate cyclase/sugar lactone lactonase YvrE
MPGGKGADALSGTLTFLFADLRGYTTYVETHGDRAAAALIADYRRLVRTQVAASSGGEIKTEGDSFYVVFSTARAALDCAIAILRDAERDVAAYPDRPMAIGIGIHAGEPVAHEGQYVGSAVNVAARLGQVAGGGELLISETVRGLLRTSGVPPMTAKRDLVLKGISDAPTAFAVDWRNVGRETFGPPVGARSRLRIARRYWIVLGLSTILLGGAIIAALTLPRPAPAADIGQAAGLGQLVTIAGLGSAGFSGDGGPATAAQLDQPTSLVFDRAGNLYVADNRTSQVGASQFARIRRIDRDGKITTLAGGGTLRFPDTDFAPNVHFDVLAYVAIDGRGDLYVTTGYANITAHWVARISEGRVRLFAGNPYGLALVGPGVGPGRGGGYSGDGGPATQALLFGPRGLVVDAGGNVYIADSGNHAIRRVSADGLIATVAGSGKLGFAGDGGPASAALLAAPLGVALSPDGSLYIADTGNHRIRKVDHGGTITTVAGDGTPGYRGDGGPGVKASLNAPAGLAFDPAGNVYIADTGNNRIRRLAPDGTITTVAGDGTGEQLLGPSAVAFDGNGVLYIADTGNHRIRRLAAPTR